MTVITSGRHHEPKARDLLLAVAISPVVIAAILFADRSVHAAPPSRAKTVWDSVYSTNQAARGETAYTNTCARCHKASLAGADESPALTGSAFLANWNGQTVGDLHERVRTSMPTDDPGTYSRQLVTDVIAYMLKVNGFPAGNAELSTVGDSLKNITIQSAKP
jgi:S-disulfanyl-L-cysteine oxidoreductase SoxD